MVKQAFSTSTNNSWHLFKAIRNGYLANVALELETGNANPNQIVRNRSLLWHAGSRGFKDICRELIRKGADPNWTYGNTQRSLLHFAVITHNYGFVSILLECGANASPRTIHGATPLHFACRTGMGYITTRLIEAGASLDVLDNQGRSPRQLARPASLRPDTTRPEPTNEPLYQLGK